MTVVDAKTNSECDFANRLRRKILLFSGKWDGMGAAK
jgi:hypothetical protein